MKADTTDAKKTTKSTDVAKGKGKKDEACNSKTENTGCGEGLKCGKVQLSTEAKDKSTGSGGISTDKLNSALASSEVCVSDADCGKEKSGSKIECDAAALAASVVTAMAVALTM